MKNYCFDCQGQGAVRGQTCPNCKGRSHTVDLRQGKIAAVGPEQSTLAEVCADVASDRTVDEGDNLDTLKLLMVRVANLTFPSMTSVDEFREEMAYIAALAIRLMEEGSPDFVLVEEGPDGR